MNRSGKILMCGILLWGVIMAAAFYLRSHTASVRRSISDIKSAITGAQGDIRRLETYRDCEKWLATRDNTRFSPPSDIVAPDSRDLSESASVGKFASRTDTLCWNAIGADEAFKVISAACAVRKTGWRLSGLDLAPAPQGGSLRLSLGFSTARPTGDGK